MDDVMTLRDAPESLDEDRGGFENELDLHDNDERSNHELEATGINEEIPRESQDENNIETSPLLKKDVDVKLLMQSDVFSCDALWCLFVAAARSYRFSSILRPFPPMYLDREAKDMFGLKSAISSIPKFSTAADFWSDIDSGGHKLLSWLYNAGNFKLMLRDRDSTFELIKEMTGQKGKAPEPTFVFEVMYHQETDKKFESLKSGRKSLYAYHGSRFDNFFSILHNGLNTHLNKVAVFGEGTYLSSELSVSLMYSQAAESCQHSLIGSKLSCVAMCEMIDDPSVKCQIKEGDASQQRSRAQASTTTDLVPEKYYVVQRNDILRVKYLLIYREQGSSIMPTATRSSSSWLRDNKFAMLMLAYILLLVAIGLANSRNTMIYLRKFWRRMNWS